MTTLYQFQVSHFCEKARWALEYKDIPYQAKTMLPGSHVKTVKKIAKKTHVPVLEIEDKVIQGSSAILSFLDEYVPERPLTPMAPGDKTAALEWEKYLDKVLGVHVRRFGYHHILPDKALLVALLSYRGPWYSKYLLSFGYGKVVKMMRRYLDINDETAAQSREEIIQACQRLQSRLADSNYLVGDSFSRADLTAAALLAPLCAPEKLPLPMDRVPPQIATLQQEIEPVASWVKDIYLRHRPPLTEKS